MATTTIKPTPQMTIGSAYAGANTKSIPTTISTEKEPFEVLNEGGETVFTTNEYQELKIKINILIKMVGKKKFMKKLNAKKEELKIVKELIK